MCGSKTQYFLQPLDATKLQKIVEMVSILKNNNRHEYSMLVSIFQLKNFILNFLDLSEIV